jgi:hypothetical protein
MSRPRDLAALIHHGTAAARAAQRAALILEWFALRDWIELRQSQELAVEPEVLDRQGAIAKQLWGVEG